MTENDCIDDDSLARFRTIGDPAVDSLVEVHCVASGEPLGPLLGRLFGAPEMPSHPLVAAYMSSLPEVEIDERDVVAQGQALFDLFGPEILLILGSCALPLAYAAGNGVQVVARARRLKDDPVRRLCDTAQMVINVMQPGELAPGGIGWYSARKVRLIHALIRQHVQMDPRSPWEPRWGTPINQEDQAGTLLTFSVGVLHGLRRMGAPIDAEQADAYIRAWAAVGRLLGVDEALLPRTEQVATDLAFRIGSRQIRTTPEGRELSKYLLMAVDGLFPVAGYAASLSHFFLEDTAFGASVADVLAIPAPNWTRWLVRTRAAQKRALLRWLDFVPGAKRRRSFVARHMIQQLLLLKRPDARAPFDIPERLRLEWRLEVQR